MEENILLGNEDSVLSQTPEIPTLYQSPLKVEDIVTGGIEEIKSSDLENKNIGPIKEKVDTLYSKIQDLKKEHLVLSDEVKSINEEIFCSSDVMASLGVLRCDHDSLKRKYVEESLERKRLYNEVIELKGNIKVFCRCSPLHQDEIGSGNSSVVDIDSMRESELQIVSSHSTKKQYKFHHVFEPEESQVLQGKIDRRDSYT